MRYLRLSRSRPARGRVLHDHHLGRRRRVLPCGPPRGSASTPLGGLDETQTILAETPFALRDPSSRGSAALPPVWWAGSVRGKNAFRGPPFSGAFLIFRNRAHNRQVGMGEQAKRDVTVPAIPLPYLVLVEADLALGRLEAILYGPTPACNPDQLLNVCVRRSVAQIVGDLLGLRDAPAHQQPASRPNPFAVHSGL